MSEVQKYTAISGFHRERDFNGQNAFFKTWVENIQKQVHQPEHLIIITDSNARPPVYDLSAAPRFPITVVPLAGDLGNCHCLLHGIKKHKFSGWTGVVLAGAMLAYCNETDMVFWEEDAMAFGDVISQMYAEIKDAGIIFGKCKFMPVEQSLFLVRHHYIPEFVRLFLGEGPQNIEENLGEHIFLRLAKQNPTMWYSFDIQFGRDRPLNYDLPVWYAQKLTPEELAELQKRKMI